MSAERKQSISPLSLLPFDESVSLSPAANSASEERHMELFHPLTPEEAYVLALQTQYHSVSAELDKVQAPRLSAEVFGTLEVEFEDWIDSGKPYQILVTPGQADSSDRLYRNKLALWERVGKLVSSDTFPEQLPHQPESVRPLLTYLHDLDERDCYDALKPLSVTPKKRK